MVKLRFVPCREESQKPVVGREIDSNPDLLVGSTHQRLGCWAIEYIHKRLIEQRDQKSCFNGFFGTE